MKTLYHFGCWERAGHYLHAPGGVSVRDNIGPFGNGNVLDGYFAPSTGDDRHRAADNPFPYQDESLAALIHTRGWTLLSMWDRSVDTRFACNTTFLIEGKFTTDEMWAMAREHYPKIVARLKAAPKIGEPA